MMRSSIDEQIFEHPLSQHHLTGACQLSQEPGWNQSEADWRLMLKPAISFGLSTSSGRLVATTLALPYPPRLAWIAMVLVSREFRRRGFATRLIRSCLAAVARRNLTAGLDATPPGREVYRKLGFGDIYRLTRLFSAQSRPPPLPRAFNIRPARPEDLEAISIYDRGPFAADRGFVLRALYRRAPDLAFVASANGNLQGYGLGRDGLVGHQIGPVVADDVKTAGALIQHAVSATKGPISLDVADQHRELHQALAEWGFTPQFPFIRMLHGHPTPIDDPARVFVVAGPELG